MLQGLGGYSLASIKNQDDNQSDSGAKVKKVIKKVSKGFVRPDSGRAGRIWDGIRFAQLALYFAKKAKGEFEPIEKLAERCADLQVSEPERRKLNKEIQVKADDYSKKALEFKVDDIPVLDGRYSKKPKVYHLKEDKSEPVNIEIPNLSKEGLRLHLARMDTLVNSRKGIKVIAEAKEKLDQAIASIESKLRLLDTGRVKQGFGVPDFAKLEIEGIEQEQEEVVEEVAEDSAAIIPSEFLVLKLAQERAAKAKGRLYALLVNIRA